MKLKILVVLLGLSFVPSISAFSRNNNNSDECTYDVDGAPMSCQAYEECFLDGGIAENINGVAYCCYGNLCEGEPVLDSYTQKLVQPLIKKNYKKKRKKPSRSISRYFKP